MTQARVQKKSRQRTKKLPQEPVQATIESLSAEGRGITHIDGQTVLIDHALEGEKVLFKYTRKTKKIAEGIAVTVIQQSDQRIQPKCNVFQSCGGCSLQHMQHQAQLELKQKTLLGQLLQFGQVVPRDILPPLTGPVWSYRNKARLGVRYVTKKDRVLVGFRERGSSYITETERCEILHESIGSIISDLAAMIDTLETRQRIPQIEVAVGDNQSVLVFRHLVPLPDTDRDRIKTFAIEHDLVIYLQPGAPDRLLPVWPEQPEPLYYTLMDHSITIRFDPADFTQVNPALNEKMVARVLELFDFSVDDQVLDLFCGLGNFSLPLARRCRYVTAVEGSELMVKKARANAALNDIGNIEFVHADLYSEQVRSAPWLNRGYDKILLDPPRSGAAEILPHLKKMQAQKIIYVSCHPATLARDAGVLVNDLGYKLTGAGIMDMFPHTAHVESIAVFDK